jgi:hypothetical protein
VFALYERRRERMNKSPLVTPSLFRKRAFGMGAMLAPLFDFVLAGVEDHEVGSASGVLNAMQQLGGAIGIAVIGTLFFSVAGDHGTSVALERMLYVEAGTLLVAMGLVFLLPMRAREGDGH